MRRIFGCFAAAVAGGCLVAQVETARIAGVVSDGTGAGRRGGCVGREYGSLT